MNKKQRLPLCALIRNEKTSVVYFVFKVDKLVEGAAYYLCCIYNPDCLDQTRDLSFYFIVNSNTTHKYSVLNTRVEEEKDGSLFHTLSYLDYDEVIKLENIPDFMVRFLSACPQFTKDKQRFDVSAVHRENKSVDLIRKSTWLERLLFNPDYLTFTVTWFSLLNSYIPFIPENLDEIAYMKAVNTRRYF